MLACRNLCNRSGSFAARHRWTRLGVIGDRAGNAHHDLLPALFSSESVPDTLRRLASLPVKFAGLAIPDPTVTAETN